MPGGYAPKTGQKSLSPSIPNPRYLLEGRIYLRRRPSQGDVEIAHKPINRLRHPLEDAQKAPLPRPTPQPRIYMASITFRSKSVKSVNFHPALLKAFSIFAHICLWNWSPKTIFSMYVFISLPPYPLTLTTLTFQSI